MDRILRGQVSFHAGDAAEQRIAREYERRGYTIVDRRWRGQAGEIDLIAEDARGLVFVEVKHSRSIAQAAGRLGPRQMRRIYAAAGEYLAAAPRGELTDTRLDVALVDGSGVFEIIENAFGQD